MNSTRHHLHNTRNKRIAIVFDKAVKSKGLCIIMHGLGGYKTQSHILAFAEAFQEAGYNTLRFDATNSFGESDGNYENATTTNYYEDLTVVIDWAKSQEWYQEPLLLIGHSLGGFCALLYAENHPDAVKAVVSVSSGVSGKLFLDSFPQDVIEEFDRTGWVIVESQVKPGSHSKLRWHNFKDDLQQYDLLEKAHLLTMPVLLIVGENDNSIPLSHQMRLYGKLPGPREFHILEGAAHALIEKEHLDRLKSVLKRWMKTHESADQT